MEKKEEGLIDVKIETQEIAFWTEVKRRADMEIDACMKSLKMNEAISEMAATKIAEERAIEDSTG